MLRPVVQVCIFTPAEGFRAVALQPWAHCLRRAPDIVA